MILWYNRHIMKYLRKLTKASTHSFTITIPKEIVKKFGWRERQNLSIEELPTKSLRIKDWKKK